MLIFFLFHPQGGVKFQIDFKADIPDGSNAQEEKEV